MHVALVLGLVSLGQWLINRFHNFRIAVRKLCALALSKKEAKALVAAAVCAWAALHFPTGRSAMAEQTEMGQGGATMIPG